MYAEVAMSDKHTLGPWVRRFLMEHLPENRNLSRNTQQSYRDALRLMIVFAANRLHKKADKLLVADIDVDIVRLFLRHLEEERDCTISTRNQRLAAIHALAAFIGQRSPENLGWSAQLRSVEFKRSTHVPVGYLDKREIDVLLAVPDQSTRIGYRDHVLLLFLYNSGARADEAAQMEIGDLTLRSDGTSTLSSVRLKGKGNKVRLCPLWAATAHALRDMTRGREDKEPVFLNRTGQPLTRFGIHDIVTRHAQVAAISMPEMQKKKVGPHTIRHTTATHLLRAGVDINTIRGWLGHVSLDTTNIYAETDLDMKAKALGVCEQKQPPGRKRWRDNPDLLAFLAQL
jgi:integrase/recombinase XerD